MPRYIITKKAGRFVAGYRNTGVGTSLELTPAQAEHEVRLGTLVPEARAVMAGSVTVKPMAAPASIVQAGPAAPAEAAPRRRRRKAS
jgi:hypothetical protein